VSTRDVRLRDLPIAYIQKTKINILFVFLFSLIKFERIGAKMRYFLLLSLFLHCNIQLFAMPIPSDKIIKYRVSSKYFNRSNGTLTEEENSNSLYNLLTQIHFGGEGSNNSNDSNKDKHVEHVDKDKNSNDVTFTTIANDHPEVKLQCLFRFYFHHEID
jgi:hypothetical protein